MVNSKHMRPQNSTRLLEFSYLPDGGTGSGSSVFLLADVLKGGSNSGVTRFRDVLFENVTTPDEENPDNGLLIIEVVPDSRKFSGTAEMAAQRTVIDEVKAYDSAAVPPGGLLALDNVNAEKTLLQFGPGGAATIQFTGTPV